MPKILNSIISPPIFVDSRKSARDSNIIQNKKQQYFTNLFHPSFLEKNFIKRENKKKNVTQIPIKNNFIGLYNYLTAPNIRNKTKHPLFLAIKFQACFEIYYRRLLIEELDQDEKGFESKMQRHLILKLQQMLSDDEYDDQDRQSSQGERQECKDDRNSQLCFQFILLGYNQNDPNEVQQLRKIMEFIDNIQNQYIVFIQKHQDIEDDFIKLEINHILTTNYKQIFNNISD